MCEEAYAVDTADAERLAPVVNHVLENAICFTKDRGRIRVAIFVEPGRAVLTVTDTGQGIAPAELPPVFKRFFRADRSRARAEGCIGLGLAVCKAVIGTHDGGIEVASELGAGSLCAIPLPLA